MTCLAIPRNAAGFEECDQWQCVKAKDSTFLTGVGVETERIMSSDES
jgi:hypothetical protein